MATARVEARRAWRTARDAESRSRGDGGRASVPTSLWRKPSGWMCGRGIQVDDGMRTSDPAIFAVGECVEHRGAVFGLVAPICRHGEDPRRSGHRHGRERVSPDGDRHAAEGHRDRHVLGRRFHSATTTTEAIVFRDAARGVHKQLVVREQPVDRRGAVWRCPRQRLVFRPDPQWHRYLRLPRRADLRSGRRRRRRLRASRACPTRRKSAAATASRRAASWAPSPSSS